MDMTWDLSFLYKGFDDPAFAADFAAIPEAIHAANQALAAEGLDDTARLELLLARSAALSDLTERIGSFCHMTLSVDAENTLAAQYADRLRAISHKARLFESAFARFVATVPDLDERIAASPCLAENAFALREMAKEVAHAIPCELESTVLSMSLSGGTAFSQLRDKLDATLVVPCDGEELSLAGVRGRAYDPDANVRRTAYEAELAAYRQIELPMSFCLNSIKQEACTLARLRGYDSVLDMTLDRSRMDRETLDAMWTACREALPDFRRYLRAKAAWLGHENGLPFYDLFAPVGQAGTYTIEEARARLLTEMGKFTPEMAAFMDNAFSARWIDLLPHVGKEGGAFCSGVHQFDRSLIMTNFQGSFSDISTLAHELGHAWHNRCMAGLPRRMTRTPMPLAETASIFNETMLSYQALRDCKPEEELNLIENGLMEATQTVVDIYSRFLFEQEVIDTRADHAMSVEELKAAMLRAQDASYGEGLDPDLRHPYMWACKSHYYSSGYNFYNFPYAFGLLFGKGVFARYLAEGSAFVPEYNRLLRSCGSGTVAEVAASVGIDVRSVDFWRSSLDVVRRDIQRFEALCQNHPA